jgi:cytochrome c oxidase subunit IV
MTHEENHITSYATNAKVLITLLLLTSLTVGAAWFNFNDWNIVIVVAIASTKIFLVLTYFMHLKHEKLIFRIMVGMVFLLLAVVFVILFFDYWFR